MTHDDVLMAIISDVDRIPQYFDSSIIKLDDNEVFVDMGAYTGDTALEFINFVNRNNRTFGKIYCYEPDPVNFEKAQEELCVYENIVLRNVGTAESNRTAYFRMNEGVQSCFLESDEDENIEVECVSIDNDIKEKISFIKMDIEGYEPYAIVGAKKHIINDKPKMAICVYHEFEHLYSLAQLIDTFGVKYKFYMRHYGFRGSETILYCVPVE